MKLLFKLFSFGVALLCQLPAPVALAEDRIVRIDDEHFSFHLNDRYRFLPAAETVRLLIDTWGRSEAQVREENPLGMIVEKHASANAGPMGIVISATHEGHIEDQNAPRLANNSVPLPRYAVRVLGRENAIHFQAFGDHFDSMRELMQSVLASSAFDSGYRYQDFNALYHRVAVSGLISDQHKLKTAAAGAPIVLLAVIAGVLAALARWVTRRRLPEF